MYSHTGALQGEQLQAALQQITASAGQGTYDEVTGYHMLKELLIFFPTEQGLIQVAQLNNDGKLNLLTLLSQPNLTPFFLHACLPGTVGSVIAVQPQSMKDPLLTTAAAHLTPHSSSGQSPHHTHKNSPLPGQRKLFPTIQHKFIAGIWMPGEYHHHSAFPFLQAHQAPVCSRRALRPPPQGMAHPPLSRLMHRQHTHPRTATKVRAVNGKQ